MLISSRIDDVVTVRGVRARSYLSLHHTLRCQKYSNTNTKLALRARTQVQRYDSYRTTCSVLRCEPRLELVRCLSEYKFRCTRDCGICSASRIVLRCTQHTRAKISIWTVVVRKAHEAIHAENLEMCVYQHTDPTQTSREDDNVEYRFSASSRYSIFSHSHDCDFEFSSYRSKLRSFPSVLASSSYSRISRPFRVSS